ncbi:hypothetical protein Y032_0046g1354 [Ancylostoma ceylanicum]|uniref:Uncharacterized protein n=1 Tax=Ancylostoma ceylanicum TaxID=53326 RepID=A0A016UDJ3_9BILA|nr:hypothetical protein Y032_0046g1354 [Ancylostoma ceylanicum]
MTLLNVGLSLSFCQVCTNFFVHRCLTVYGKITSLSSSCKNQIYALLPICLCSWDSSRQSTFLISYFTVLVLEFNFFHRENVHLSFLPAILTAIATVSFPTSQYFLCGDDPITITQIRSAWAALPRLLLQDYSQIC